VNVIFLRNAWKGRSYSFPHYPIHRGKKEQNWGKKKKVKGNRLNSALGRPGQRGEQKHLTYLVPEELTVLLAMEGEDQKKK